MGRGARGLIRASLGQASVPHSSRSHISLAIPALPFLMAPTRPLLGCPELTGPLGGVGVTGHRAVGGLSHRLLLLSAAPGSLCSEELQFQLLSLVKQS